MEAGDDNGITPVMQAAFEAGIKLGALYHQFIGSPVSRDSADSLERGMSEAMGVRVCVPLGEDAQGQGMGVLRGRRGFGGA